MTDVAAAASQLYETFLCCRHADGPVAELESARTLARELRPAFAAHANRALFEVIAIALDDLHALERAGDNRALRNLGYAFHSLPELLLTTDFDRNLYVFSLRILAFHWSALSEQLKGALATLLDENRIALEARVAAPGFARSMY